MHRFCLLREGNFQLKFSIFFQAKHGRLSRAPAAAAQGHSAEPAATDVTLAKAGSEARLETEMSLLGSRHRSLSSGKQHHGELPRCASGAINAKVRVSVFCVVSRTSSPHHRLGFQTNS